MTAARRGACDEEMGVLPPGDVRNCLVALADDESLMGALFNYRLARGVWPGTASATSSWPR